MNHEEPRENLWMVSGAAPGTLLIHSGAVETRRFAPIWFDSQAVDRIRNSGVIPLRTPSYQLLPVFKSLIR
jgi:hypothetical protein